MIIKDTLNSEILEKELIRRGLNIIAIVKECDSTQIYAKRIKADKDTLIVAKEQKNGLGRLQRKFVSKEGGVYFSLIKTNKDNHSVLQIIPLISVAIFNILKSYGLNPAIKWPNDILIDGKKICGILCNIKDNRIIIGVGINVYNDISEVKDIATTLYKEKKLDYSRVEIIASVLKEFYNLVNENFNEIIEIYKENLNIINKTIKVTQQQKEFIGIVRGIDENGFLIMEKEDKKSVIMYGDITLTEKSQTYK